MMEIQQVRAFLAVAEELHFGRAAERLGVLQPPLSRTIRALEDELGVSLFQRTTRNVKLSPEGEALIEPARKMLEYQSLAVDSVQRAASGETGRISFGFARSSSRALAASTGDSLTEAESRNRLQPRVQCLRRGGAGPTRRRNPRPRTGQMGQTAAGSDGTNGHDRTPVRSSARRPSAGRALLPACRRTRRRRLHHTARPSQFDAAREHAATVPRCRLHASRGAGGPGLADDWSPRRRRAGDLNHLRLGLSEYA